MQARMLNYTRWRPFILFTKDITPNLPPVAFRTIHTSGTLGPYWMRLSMNTLTNKQRLPATAA